MRQFLLFLSIAVTVLFVSCATMSQQEGNIPPSLAEYEQYAAPYTIKNDGNLHFYFIAASNGAFRTSYKTGDACLVVFPDGEIMLIDCCIGSYTPILITSLLKMGISSIDYLVVTHPHTDHAGGIYKNEEYSLPDYVTVGMFYYNGLDCDVNKKSISKMEEHGVPCDVLCEGSELDIGGVHLYVINPPSSEIGKVSDEEEYVNNTSITIVFEYRDFSALFTGDLYIRGEKRLVDLYPDLLDVDLLKVCHHGRNTSSCETFVSAVTPSLAVVTGNCTMDTGLYSLFRKYGAEVLLDFCDGYVHVWSDGSKMQKENSLKRNVTFYDRY